MWRISVTLVVLLALVALVIMPRLRYFIAIDTCLDHGGAWNYERNVCEWHPDTDPTSGLPIGDVPITPASAGSVRHGRSSTSAPA